MFVRKDKCDRCPVREALKAELASRREAAIEAAALIGGFSWTKAEEAKLRAKWNRGIRRLCKP